MWGSKWGRITALVTETVQESTGGTGGTGIFEDTSDTTWQDTTDTEFDTEETISSVVKVVGIKLDEKFPITSSAQYVVRIRRSDTDTSQVLNLSTHQ